MVGGGWRVMGKSDIRDCNSNQRSYFNVNCTMLNMLIFFGCVCEKRREKCVGVIY